MTVQNKMKPMTIILAVELVNYLDKGQDKPLFAQIYSEICRLILTQNLRGGAKLPSSRSLATDMGLSRTTIVSAYGQLEAEGYIEARRGAGFFVVDGLGETIEPTNPIVMTGATGKIITSRRSGDLKGIKFQRTALAAFDSGKPDLEHFPFEQWSRILAKSWRKPMLDQLYEGENGGYAPLKEEISLYLMQARGLHCEPEQIILTSSTHEAIEVLTQVLLEEGDRVWVEDPVYNSALQAFLRAGVKPISVRVDEEGFSITRALAKTPDAKLAFVTPSRQYPLGQTMSLSRRLALIDWARSRNTWLVEDDYDSEYRYRGQPLPPLASRDGFARTIYLGTFSKVMFPALRLSYIVAPKALVIPLLDVFQSTGKQASILAQPALAEFMKSGQFAQHVRRTKRLYAKRHAALHEALGIYGADLFRLDNFDSGMHIVAHFKPMLTSFLTDVEAVEHLRKHSLISSALSKYFQTQPKRQGLILGFAAVPEEDITSNVKRMTEILRKFL